MSFCTQNDREMDAAVLTVCVGYSVNDILLDPSHISNKKGDLYSKRETNLTRQSSHVWNTLTIPSTAPLSTSQLLFVELPPTPTEPSPLAGSDRLCVAKLCRGPQLPACHHRITATHRGADDGLARRASIVGGR